jgi:hypothetical protein
MLTARCLVCRLWHHLRRWFSQMHCPSFIPFFLVFVHFLLFSWLPQSMDKLCNNKVCSFLCSILHYGSCASTVDIKLAALELIAHCRVSETAVSDIPVELHGAMSQKTILLRICILRQFYTFTPWSESVSELYRPSDCRLSANWLPTFADRGWHVVSVTDPYGRILGFLDRSRYISIK